MNTAETAATLGLSQSTVAGYLTNAARKLGSSQRSGMVHRAYTLGELDPPERITLGARVEVTSRERWILQGLADGRTLEEIAAGTGLYMRPVRADARGLNARLGAESIAHLITRAWQVGLLGPKPTQRATGPSTAPSEREKTS